MKIGRNNIFLIGPMGAGKTSVGRFLARQLHKDFYDSDEEVEKMTGAHLGWIFDMEGETGFRQREMKAIDALTKLSGIVLATGGGCVETPEVREFLRQRGVVVYLHVSLEIQIDRLKRDKKRPLLQGDDPQEVIIRMIHERESFYEKIADMTVMTDQRSVKDVSEDILAWLGSGK